jgi:hypothetical protein
MNARARPCKALPPSRRRFARARQRLGQLHCCGRGHRADRFSVRSQPVRGSIPPIQQGSAGVTFVGPEARVPLEERDRAFRRRLPRLRREGIAGFVEASRPFTVTFDEDTRNDRSARLSPNVVTRQRDHRVRRSAPAARCRGARAFLRNPNAHRTRELRRSVGRVMRARQTRARVPAIAIPPSTNAAAASGGSVRAFAGTLLRLHNEVLLLFLDVSEPSLERSGAFTRTLRSVPCDDY